MKINPKAVFFLVVFLGFLTIGAAQQIIITTTTTTLITIPGTTYVTTLPGGEITATIVIPKYTLIAVEKRPDQTCSIVLKPIKTEGVITIPGTTVTIPGTTVQTVFTEPTIKYSITYEEDGVTTTTGYTYIELVTTIAGQTFSIPIPLYAEIIESCQTIQVVQEVTIIMGSVPATFYYAYPEMTYSFEGATFTIEEMTEELPTTITTTTITPGTTYTESTVFPGTTMATTITLPSTTVTVTEPEKTVTSTITYVTTITRPTTETTPTTPTPTTTTQTTPTTVTTPTPTPTLTETETTRPGMEFAGLPLDILAGIIATVAIIAIVVAALLFRRGAGRIR